MTFVMFAKIKADFCHVSIKSPTPKDEAEARETHRKTLPLKL